MIHTLLTNLFLTGALVGLTACGGGGGGSTTTPPTQPAPTDPTDGGPTPGGDTDGVDTSVDLPDIAPGTNGLSFGASGQSLSDVETEAVVSRAAAIASGGDITIDTAIARLDAGFVDATAATRSGTLEINGETVAITNGAGTLSTGEPVTVTFEPNRAGTYAGVVEVTIAGLGADVLRGETVFAFGFETDPDTIAARTSGTLTYRGDFQAFGSLNGADDTASEYEGEITLLADFTGSGSVDVDLDGRLNGATDAALTGTIAIEGNGFAGTLSCGVGCTNNGSAISAGFFGPDADEVAGVVGVDINAGDDTFAGVGSFVLTDPQ